MTLSGGKLALQGQYTGSITAGLLGKYYLGAPADNYIDSVADIAAHFGPLTPTATAPSTAGGYTTFNFGNYAVSTSQGDFGPNSGDPADSATTAQPAWPPRIFRSSGPASSTLTAGTYSFGTLSDDGSAIYIDPNNDGQYVQVVNNLSTHGPQVANGSIPLSAGLHNVVLAYYQATSGYYLQRPSGPERRSSRRIQRHCRRQQSLADGLYHGCFVLIACRRAKLRQQRLRDGKFLDRRFRLAGRHAGNAGDRRGERQLHAEPHRADTTTAPSA